MSNIKTMVRGTYDIQQLRIQMGNRIVSNFKAKLGQEPSTPEEEMDKDAQNILKKLRRHYRKITDGVKTFPRQTSFKGDEVISTYTELCLISQYLDLETSEAQHFRRLGHVLKEYPIWTEFMEGVKGIGPAMAGVIISEFDIHKAKYSSSMWRYAGLDVAEDGKGRSKRKEHLIDIEYTAADGTQKTKKGITFNPFLRTKLLGVLATSFLLAGPKNNPYRKVFDDYKHRLDNMPAHADKSKGHKNNMARRYMVKIFIIHLYEHWRALEGLPVYDPYHEAKLGLKHGET
jgi:hypothetical protein